MDPQEALDLAGWRREIASVYSSVRSAHDPADGWRLWRAERDRLFATHPQSPIPKNLRGSFKGLPYFDYNPRLRFSLELVAVQPRTFDVSSSESIRHAFSRFATTDFRVDGIPVSIEIYWLEGYTGGLFLPFRDAGAGRFTYGGGRYVLDTAKGADLGTEAGRLIVDFNFAYQPSCAYDDRWVCPLAPSSNVLPVEIAAGEKRGL